MDETPNTFTDPNAQISSISMWTNPGVTVIIVSQTLSDPSSTVTSERTVTNAAGQATAETFESILTGKTNAFASTMTIGDSASDSQQNIIVSQTVVGSQRVKYFCGEDHDRRRRSDHRANLPDNPTR